LPGTLDPKLAGACPLFAIAFSAKKQACGPEARALRGKSIAPVISDCGFRIADFFAFLFQSAFRNLQSAIWRRAYRAVPNSEFGMWNSEFFSSFLPFRIPHSTSRILVARPTQKMNRAL
jgi:hypothetical protein